MLPNKPKNGQLPIAIDHMQLWTMASETVDRIDWPVPPTPWRGNSPSPPIAQMQEPQYPPPLDEAVHAPSLPIAQMQVPQYT